jgi:hypothetical protein
VFVIAFDLGGEVEVLDAKYVHSQRAESILETSIEVIWSRRVCMRS